jgi:hypothetical protein
MKDVDHVDCRSVDHVDCRSTASEAVLLFQYQFSFVENIHKFQFYHLLPNFSKAAGWRYFTVALCVFWVLPGLMYRYCRRLSSVSRLISLLPYVAICCMYIPRNISFPFSSSCLIISYWMSPGPGKDPSQAFRAIWNSFIEKRVLCCDCVLSLHGLLLLLLLFSSVLETSFLLNEA